MIGQRQPVYIFCDGSTGALERGAAGRAPSPAGAAAVRPPANSRCTAAAVARRNDGALLAVEWQVLPPLTNNEAEYAGLLLGMEIARKLHAPATIFVLDSETVVRQMTGRCAVNSPGLKTWHGRACAAARGLRGVRYQAIPREYNRFADGVAAQAAIAWAELMLVIHGKPGSNSQADAGGRMADRDDK